MPKDTSSTLAAPAAATTRRDRPPTSARESVPKPPGVHKRGKRIVSLLQNLQGQQNQGSIPPRDPREPDDARGYPRRATRADADDAPSPTHTLPSTAHACLLGVPGLTRHSLDVCLATFFEVAHYPRLSQPRELFLRRVRVLLYDAAGLEVPAHLAGVPAASPLLALAVACLGSPSSRYANLEQALYDTCAAIAGGDGLITSGIDAIEAANLLAECRIAPPPSSKPADPLKLDPLSPSFAVDLTLYLGLHMSPPKTDPDYARREALFWTVWASDALRAVSATTRCRLMETAIGWSMPTRIGRDPLMALAGVARDVCDTMLSPKSAAIGLRDADVQAVLFSLDSLRDMDVDGDDDNGSSRAETLTYLHSTRNWLYVVCWAAVRVNTTHPTATLPGPALADVDAAVMRATERMAAIAEAVPPSSIPQPVRDHMVVTLLFLVHKFSEPIRERQAAHYSSLAGPLLHAVRGAITVPNSVDLADALDRAIERARAGMSPSARTLVNLWSAAPPRPPSNNGVPTFSHFVDAINIRDGHSPSGRRSTSREADNSGGPTLESDNVFSIERSLLEFVARCGVNIPLCPKLSAR